MKTVTREELAKITGAIGKNEECDNKALEYCIAAFDLPIANVTNTTIRKKEEKTIKCDTIIINSEEYNIKIVPFPIQASVTIEPKKAKRSKIDNWTTRRIYPYASKSSYDISDEMLFNKDGINIFYNNKPTVVNSCLTSRTSHGFGDTLLIEKTIGGDCQYYLSRRYWNGYCVHIPTRKLIPYNHIAYFAQDGYRRYVETIHYTDEHDQIMHMLHHTEDLDNFLIGAASTTKSDYAVIAEGLDPQEEAIYAHIGGIKIGDENSIENLEPNISCYHKYTVGSEAHSVELIAKIGEEAVYGRYMLGAEIKVDEQRSELLLIPVKDAHSINIEAIETLEYQLGISLREKPYLQGIIYYLQKLICGYNKKRREQDTTSFYYNDYLDHLIERLRYNYCLCVENPISFVESIRGENLPADLFEEIVPNMPKINNGVSKKITK